MFHQTPELVNQYVSDPKFVTKLLDGTDHARVSTLERVRAA